MPHFQRILPTLSVLACVVFFTAPQAYAADKYCVEQIPFSTQMPQTTLKPASQKEILPRYSRQFKDGAYPVVFDSFNIEAEDGTTQGGGKAFWLFNEDKALNGPYIPDYRVSGDMLANAAGDIYFIGQKKAQDMEGYEKRIFHMTGSKGPQPISPAAEEQLKWSQEIFYSALLDGFFVNSSDHAGYGVTKFRTSLLRDGKVIPLQDAPVKLAKDLPQYGIVALFGHDHMSIVDQDLNVTHVTKLNFGDDYGGVSDIHEMSDRGWFYVTGGQYDHFIHMAQEAGKWAVDKKIMIWPPEVNEEGWFEKLLRYLLDMKGDQIKRDGLTDIVTAGKCRIFSKALGRFILCDPMEEWRPDGFHRLPKGSSPWERYDGDIEKLKVAVLRDREGTLYAYDGTKIHRMEGAKVRRGLIISLDNGRVFYNSLDGNYEIQGNTVESLKVVPIEHDLPKSSDLMFLKPIAMPNGDLFFFTRKGIFLLKDNHLVEFWAPPEGARLNITGAMTPIWVQSPQMVIFSTSVEVAGRKEILSFSACP